MGMHCNHLCWADELDKDIDEAVAKAIEEQRKRILRPDVWVEFRMCLIWRLVVAILGWFSLVVAIEVVVCGTF
ncbi:hypothetical protein JHK87_006472 [Glycine soja]|nr:hypothetical protein JHK87_006472 [Glycine soja]